MIDCVRYTCLPNKCANGTSLSSVAYWLYVIYLLSVVCLLSSGCLLQTTYKQQTTQTTERQHIQHTAKRILCWLSVVFWLPVGCVMCRCLCCLLLVCCMLLLSVCWLPVGCCLWLSVSCLSDKFCWLSAICLLVVCCRFFCWLFYYLLSVVGCLFVFCCLLSVGGLFLVSWLSIV